MADQFSFQDLQDLRQIRQSLPPDHPAGAKIDAVLNAAPPNSGLAPPASPGLPQGLRQTPSLIDAAGIRDPQQRGAALSQRMMEDAAPIGQAAQQAGSMMPLGGIGNAAIGSAIRGTGSVLGGVGKLAQFGEDYLAPRFALPVKSPGKLIGSLAESMKGFQTPTEWTPPAVPATTGPQRGIPQGPKPSVGRYQPPERVLPTPRPSLVKQMGGKPVEEMTDQALKQKMEESPEVSYGKYAKRHAGPSSKSFPEPENWQDQPPENAPWGGTFYRR